MTTAANTVPTSIPLGEILVRQGRLKPEQVRHLLAVQRSVGRPFGDLAERLYGVSPRAVEDAWAEQYAQLAPADADDLLPTCEATGLLNRRQAWQFGILPVAIDEAGELKLVTSRRRLVRAVNFALGAFARPVTFAVVDDAELDELLMAHYPVPTHLKEYATQRIRAA